MLRIWILRSVAFGLGGCVRAIIPMACAGVLVFMAYTLLHGMYPESHHSAALHLIGVTCYLAVVLAEWSRPGSRNAQRGLVFERPWMASGSALVYGLVFFMGHGVVVGIVIAAVSFSWSMVTLQDIHPRVGMYDGDTTRF